MNGEATISPVIDENESAIKYGINMALSGIRGIRKSCSDENVSGTLEWGGVTVKNGFETVSKLSLSVCFLLYFDCVKLSYPIKTKLVY